MHDVAPGWLPRSVYYETRRRLRCASPAAFLAMAAGGPRGFWAFGERWVAHAGVLSDLEMREEGGSGSPTEPNQGASRFRVVEDRMASVFASCSGRARLFGGLSFSAGHRARGLWASFPLARFHLPAVEMEWRPGEEGSWLAARDRDPGRAEARCRRWADAMEAKSALGSDRLHRDAGCDGSAGRAGPVDGGAERAAWDKMVGAALRRIRAGEADKVVLARTVEAVAEGDVEPAALATALWRENRGSYVFLFEPAPGHALVGAAPEAIATLAGRTFRATAVAGSAGVGRDSVEAARLGRQLLNSDKDRAEHDFVVDDMVARLEALGCDVRRDVEPHVLSLAHIQHLETKIAAEAPPGLSVLEALASLHPTPAVCGIPREVALGILTESEVFERGWYAGPVGWLDSEGRGVFVPALRSAVRSGGRWHLFAGAGIVPGSDPALEWEETEIKLRPVRRAMAKARMSQRGVAGVREAVG